MDFNCQFAMVEVLVDRKHDCKLTIESCRPFLQSSWAGSGGLFRSLIEAIMSTKDERMLARQLFKCRAMLANAKAFQDLFWDVMKAKHGDAFATVAPQGKKGDGGNDGYLPSEKHYFQLYAPVNPKEKLTVAAKKVSTDFAKVKKEWGTKTRGISKFYFGFNDKYEGLPKEIEQALNGLRPKHVAIVFAQYCCRDLETDFMSLPDTEWDRILGMPIPDPA